MGAKDLMRKSHMTGRAIDKPLEPVEKPVITEEVAATLETVVKEKPTVLTENVPTSIQQVKRPDVSMDEYGIKPDITNFQLYNYELSEFLTTFSKKNKKNGGNPITKSQLMETVLGFAFYDLGLSPDGYDNTQALLKDLQAKVKK